MKYTNSPLVEHTRISPNRSKGRVHATHNPKGVIDVITIHHTAGKISLETLGNIFAPSSRQASSNYGVGDDGRIGMYCEEKDRSWCTSSAANDYRAITIEVVNSQSGGNWPVSDKALAATIKLCIDICKRNNIKEIRFTGDKKGNLTMHKWFANTNCPGPYLESKFPYIAAEINKALKGKEEPKPTPAPSGKLYRVQTGAFGVRKNADNLEAKLKKAGFDTYMVKVGNLYKVQVGAYSVKANADAMAAKLKKAGFDTFITTESGSPVGNAPTAPAKKSIQVIAKEVVDGKWGNGADRKKRLEAAGYNYNQVQAEVNKLVSTPSKKSINTIAKEVINGDWGNGAERKKRLEAAGYNYSAVQKEVNRLL